MLKVDILNIMGPAIAFAAMMSGVARTRSARLVTFGLATAFMTLATPLVRETHLLDFLPDPIEAYFRPLPGRNGFTLFPWAGFVFAGTFVGTLLDRTRVRAEDVALHAWFAVSGIALAVASHYGWYLPSPYPHTEFWTTSPTFFFMRVGILVAAVGLMYFQQSAEPLTAIGRARPMQRFGRSSLFVYWIHVEMVYGTLTVTLQHRLSILDAIGAFALFSLLMFGLVVVKDWLKERWKRRQGPAAERDLTAAAWQQSA
jgi:uncharacterized membrane protein